MNLFWFLYLLVVVACLVALVGIMVYLYQYGEQQYRWAVTERLRAQEAEAALQVKHQIEHLYTQARDYIRRAP